MDISSGLSCTPLQVYLGISFISPITHYAIHFIKDREFPSAVMIVSQVCGVLLCGCFVTGLCVYSTMFAWVCVLIIGLFSCSGMMMLVQ